MKTRRTRRSMGRGELSSDDEVAKQSPRSSPSKTPRKVANLEAYLPQVVELSDKELFEELQNYGEAPGPITDTTRSIYQRKLAKKMAEKTKGTSKARETVKKESRQVVATEEWSSQEETVEDDIMIGGEEEEEEEEEGEGEGEGERVISFGRQKPRATRQQQVSYVRYVSPRGTYVESSYLRHSPSHHLPHHQRISGGGHTGTGVVPLEQSTRRSRAKPSQMQQPVLKLERVKKDKQPRPHPPPPPPPSSAKPTGAANTAGGAGPCRCGGFLLSFLVLLLAFAVVLLAVNHTTTAPPNESFLTQMYNAMPFCIFGEHTTI